MTVESRSVTELLERAGDDSAVAARLLPLVYDELRNLAGGYLDKENAGHTLQPTALVHEAFLRLVGMDQVDWQDRNHFFALGARAMRRILIDHARGRRRAKRGGDGQRVELHSDIWPVPEQGTDILALHEALEQLAQLDERQAKVVELRFFGGLTMDEVATTLNVSKRTAEGDWKTARAWLMVQLKEGLISHGC
jgi:RNA polymerase sigma-70 factor, ECF subfamily